ncbi:hypothetical protein KH5_07790 [Urechidicola sp. KH5]
MTLVYNRYKNLTRVIPTLLLVICASCNVKTEQLIWEENFDTTVLNSENWSFDIGDGCPHLCGWGNNESQIYTNSNHSVKNGFLTITTRKEDSIYTSTRINSKDKFEFTYGRVEIKAKLPQGKGLWPALWMLGGNIDQVGWPKCGEIDIVEYVGRKPNNVFFSLHTADSFGNTINTQNSEIPAIEDGFHVYEINWTVDSISFFVDKKHLYTFNPSEKTEEIWPFDKPFYFVINTAVGGKFGGYDINNSVFPQEFIIDYIRVYQ